MLSTFSLKYVAVASKALVLVPNCFVRETRELSPFAAYDIKRRANRAEDVQQRGITISPTQMVAHYPGDAIVSAGKQFTSPFQTVTEFTKKIVSAEVNQDCWNEVSPT